MSFLPLSSLLSPLPAPYLTDCCPALPHLPEPSPLSSYAHRLYPRPLPLAPFFSPSHLCSLLFPALGTGSLCHCSFISLHPVSLSLSLWLSITACLSLPVSSLHPSISASRCPSDRMCLYPDGDDHLKNWVVRKYFKYRKELRMIYWTLMNLAPRFRKCYICFRIFLRIEMVQLLLKPHCTPPQTLCENQKCPDAFPDSLLQSSRLSVAGNHAEGAGVFPELQAEILRPRL